MTTSDKLKAASRAARSRSYSPYSEFQVGVAIQTATGEILDGANIEYHGRNSFHAEEVAIIKALNRGHREIVALAHSSQKQSGHVPCGRCLGLLAEFGEDTVIFLDEGQKHPNTDDPWRSTSLNKELPNAYRGGRDK